MPRFNESKYDHVKESSSELEKLAKSSGCVALLIKVERDEKGKVKESCPCGCGHMPVGPRSKFMMGHDARLRGKLIRAHLTGTKIIEVKEEDGKRTEAKPLTAKVVARRHDWTEYLEKAELRREGKNRQVAQKAMGSKRLVKLGRWEYTGQVVAVYEGEDGETFDIEYVTKSGEVKTKKGVPATQAPVAK